MKILRSLGYPNRIVLLLTPILAPLVGAFASWVADNVPGLPEDSLNEIFLAAATITLAPALLFMHNRFRWDVLQEKQQALGSGRSEMGPPTAEDFAELGIEDPASELLAFTGAAGAQAEFAEDEGDASFSDAEADFVDEGGEALDDDEPFDDDVLDELSGILDEADDVEELEEPDQPTTAGV